MANNNKLGRIIVCIKLCAYLRGLIMARCRSTAIAVNVNTETLTLTVWTNGKNGHMKYGKFQRCKMAA